MMKMLCTLYILLWIGHACIDIYNDWSWENANNKTKPIEIWNRYE